jgi:hypothetical protein
MAMQPLPYLSFNHIVMEDDIGLELTTTPSSVMTLTGERNIIPGVNITVEDKVLRLGQKEGCWNRTKPLTLSSPFDSVNSAVLEGMGELKFLKSFKQKEFNSVINGTGSITFSGGFINRHNIVIDGEGDVLAENVITPFANVLISGTGGCKLQVTDTLIVTITGSGNVYYKGNPVIIKTITGSGAILEGDY